MSTDTARILQELEIVTGTLIPDADMTKLKIRYEEIVANYQVERKTLQSLENDLSDKITLYINAMQLEGQSELTLVGNERELLKFAEYVNKPAVQVNTPDIRSYLSTNPDWAAGTVARKLAVIKSFYRWCVDEEMLLRNPANKIRPPKQPKRLPKAITATELETLREACESLRDRALIEVMYSTGCRLSEVAGMKLTDIDWRQSSLSVVGKGNKERIVYLNEKAVYHLKKYLAEREYDENESEYLFTTSVRPYRKMASASIRTVICKISDRSNLNKHIHPHVLRHTFATLAMDNGIELGDLQQLMGHVNSSTTLRYATVSEERKHNAHKRFVQ